MSDKKDYKLLTIYQYFNYSVFVREKDSVVEKFCIDAEPLYGAITENTKDVDKMVSMIRSRVRENTLADVVMVTVYQMAMNKESYDKIRNMFPKLSEEEIMLDIYKRNLYEKGAITVLAVLPLVFNERVSVGRLIS